MTHSPHTPRCTRSAEHLSRTAIFNLLFLRCLASACVSPVSYCARFLFAILLPLLLFSGISWFFFCSIHPQPPWICPAELISHSSFSWVLIKDFLWLKIEIRVVNMLRSLHLGPAGSMFVARMWPQHLTRSMRETTDRILPTILALFWGHFFFQFRILMRSTHASRSGHSQGG